MRISVCEFLRLNTRTDWFYAGPGQWISNRGVYEAVRINATKYSLYKHGRYQKILHYYEGRSSNVTRAANQRLLKKRKKLKQRRG